MLPDRSLEIEAEGEAETTLSDVGTVGIADTPYIVEANQGKDVVKTDTHLHIRSLAHGLSVRQFGETIEVIVIGRVVLLGQATDEALEGHHLAKVEFLDQRNSVQDKTIQVILEVEHHELVHRELHRVEQAESFGLSGVRQVGELPAESGVLHLIPELTGAEEDIEGTESGEPEAFLHIKLGEVVGELRPQETLRAISVREADDECIEIDGAAIIITLQEFLAGSPTKLHLQIILRIIGIDIAETVYELHMLRSLLLGIIEAGMEREVVEPLDVILQLAKSLVSGERCVRTLDRIIEHIVEI